MPARYICRCHYSIKFDYIFLPKLQNFTYRLKIQNKRLEKTLLTSYGAQNNCITFGLYTRFANNFSRLFITKYIWCVLQSNDKYMSVHRVFSLRVMFALLHLQTCLPRLQFAQTRLCTKGMLRCSPSSLWSYFNQRFEFSQIASTFRLSFF